MPDLPPLRGHLPESRPAKVLAIDGHDWRTLRTAISLQRPNAELIFERHGHAVLQLLRSHQDILQRTKALGRAAPAVLLQKHRDCDKECDLVLLYDRADHLGIQW